MFCVVYLEAGVSSRSGWDDFEVLEMDGKGPLKGVCGELILVCIFYVMVSEESILHGLGGYVYMKG